MLQSSTDTTRSKVRSSPLFIQVKKILFKQIMSGRWNPGEPIPSESVLARDFEVSVSTIRKAVDELEAERLLVRNQGRGTFVSKFSKEDLLILFYRYRFEDGTTAIPSSKILDVSERAVDEIIATALQVPLGTQMRCIERVRYVNGKATIHDWLYLVAEKVPRLTDFENEERPDGLYFIMQRDFHLRITRTNDRLRAVGAPKAIAIHLGITPGDPVMEIRRIGFDPEQNPVEYRVSHALTDDIHYDVEHRGGLSLSRKHLGV